MDELYKYIDTWDGKMLFTYISIFLFVLWYFSTKKIGTNFLVSLIVAAFVINYFNHKTITSVDSKKDIIKLKKEHIKPKTKNGFKHHDVVNFLFSVQDLYHYNPLQYEHMVKYVDEFFEMYTICFVDKQSSYYNYGLMKHAKRCALNSLSSIIFSLPNDKRIREKVNNASVILDDILTKYLDHISFLIDEHIYKNGYNVNTKIIDYGPKAFNEYEDMFKPYSYELY